MKEKTAAGAIDMLTIKPSKGMAGFDLRGLWEYRELLYFLVWRDLKVRYRHTIIGMSWVVIQPVLAAAIFSVVFGLFMKLPSDNVPYILFVFCALLPWNFFASTVTKIGEGLLVNRNLITKVYFPRMMIPTAMILNNVIDFCIALSVFLVFLFLYKIKITLAFFCLPLFVLLALALTTGLGFWLCALNVKYRDVHYAAPFLIQVWLYSSPVAYTDSIIPRKWLLVYALNPMVGIIDGFRWSLLGGSHDLAITVLLSVLTTGAILILGIRYFLIAEKDMADII
jgi:lipopolysaccharide transport system permease protein